MIEKDEMFELIREAKGRQLEILIKLMAYNKEASLYMKAPKKTYKQKYRAMWRERFWYEAKALLYEYFSLEGNGTVFCEICHQKVGKKFILHHYPEFYKGSFKANFFTPLYLTLLCSNQCHAKEHEKESKK